MDIIINGKTVIVASDWLPVLIPIVIKAAIIIQHNVSNTASLGTNIRFRRSIYFRTKTPVINKMPNRIKPIIKPELRKAIDIIAGPKTPYVCNPIIFLKIATIVAANGKIRISFRVSSGIFDSDTFIIVSTFTFS